MAVGSSAVVVRFGVGIVAVSEGTGYGELLPGTVRNLGIALGLHFGLASAGGVHFIVGSTSEKIVVWNSSILMVRS